MKYKYYKFPFLTFIYDIQFRFSWSNSVITLKLIFFVTLFEKHQSDIFITYFNDAFLFLFYITRIKIDSS